MLNREREALNAAANELAAALDEAMNGKDTTRHEMARRVIEAYKAHGGGSDGE